MLHHTLLPYEEVKKLKNEYRIRLAITALLFISSALVVGVLALFPAHTLSRIQEDAVTLQVRELDKMRKVQGVDQIESDLDRVRTYTEKINEYESPLSFTDGIKKIISHRNYGIYINSFDMSFDGATSSKATVVVQGKAINRDTLIEFRKNLENDSYFSKVELPLSDLAKSKDVNFSLRLFIKK